MKKFYFLLILLFLKSSLQIKQNPIYLVDRKNPFVLSSNDNYYYVITIGNNLKINQESGNIENNTDNYADEESYIFIADNSYNNYLYYSNEYYKIIYDPFLSYEKLNINEYYSNFKPIGFISINNTIIIYGCYNNDFFMFSTNFVSYSKIEVPNIINYKIICKYIEGEDFVCGIILNSKFSLYCLNYHIDPNNNENNALSLNNNTFIYGDSFTFGLYDTDKYNIKLFCCQNDDNIICKFIRITINQENHYISYDLLGDNNLVFTTANNFIENNCYFLIFNYEYLLCCAITNYLKCYKIYNDTYNIIKEFQISITGDNSYLTIKNNNNYMVLFFMNKYNNRNYSVYEYYIYLPKCQNKNYDILINGTDSKPQRELDAIGNLFSVKTDKYYFEIENMYDDFGYFLLNNTRINQRTLIENDNDILVFTFINNNNSFSFALTVNYTVSVEDEEAYTDHCQITINFKSCYHSCQKCFKDSNNSNDIEHNCINCKDNYYQSPENNGNCYSINEKKINWYFNSSKLEFGLCHNECVCSCIGPNISDCIPCSDGIFIDKNISEFKNMIKDNIISYVNSTKVINGTNFLAMVLSSDNMKPEDQLKSGISAIDLGNCTNILKEYYNISDEENLIILNMESKKDENNNDEDKSFNLGKNTQIEIYDYSGSKLNLSICNEGIKIMKYIGDADELNIESAKILSEQGIDVFNAADDFFNDICHSYDNPDGMDIIISDRRNNIYQNVTFCQNGCTYNGINYNLMAANCLCDSSILEEEEENNNMTNTNLNIEISNFKTITKAFLQNLLSFNFEVLKCNNLFLNIKILSRNIGFYNLSSMFVLQIIFFFVYLIKKLKPLKHFMLIFKNNNDIKNSQNNNNFRNTPPPKNISTIIPNNRNNKNKKYDKKDKYIKIDFNENQKNKLNNKYNKIKKENINKNKIMGYDSFNNNLQNDCSKNAINLYKFHKIIQDSKKSILISNNISPNINIKKQIIINNNSIKENKLSKINNNNIFNIRSLKQRYLKNGKKNIKYIHNMETIQEINKNIKYKIYKANMIQMSKLSKNDSDMQELDYEEAIILDKRSYLKMCWGYLIDSQIILGTFFINNNLDLFVIKLSFLVITFQTNFFLNALFYTDDYISDAYHNNGTLDFFSGLPKSIYSFIATLIITNILRMFSNSKNELMRVIRRNSSFNNYINIINIKLAKLRKKLIIYFILVFLFSSFFLYYVSVFCAVYKYSQKYWFLGCLESFGIDFLVALLGSFLIGLLRYISIKNHMKCLYIFANILNIFL